MIFHSSILIASCFLFIGCSNGYRAVSTPDSTSLACVEECRDQTFVGNCNSLRTSDGFRQNCWLSSKQGSIGAICMDRDHQLYLVIDTELPLRSPKYQSQRFRSLQDSPSNLRKRLDPDAFILDREGIDWISHIPLNAEESFAADLMNELCGLSLKHEDIRYGWD